MTLEAGKEMDRRCVINWLNEVYITPSRAFNEYTEDELKMFAYDALALLKEYEPINDKPRKNGYWIHPTTLDCCCSICGEQPEREPGESVPLYDYCPYCGASMEIKWDD